MSSKFTKQYVPTLKKGGIIIPSNAELLLSLDPSFSELLTTSDSYQTQRYHYIDIPYSKIIFEDNYKIDTGIYKFYLADGVIQLCDALITPSSSICWSFASTDQIVLLTALRIGETFDVKLKVNFDEVIYIEKIHFPSGVSDSSYGNYPIHITTEKVEGNFLRIVTSYESNSPRTNSRLPFFFAFKVYGFRRENRQPLWRKLLSQSVICAHKNNWGMGLLHLAFSLESFIDQILLAKLSKANLGKECESQLLTSSQIKIKLHALFNAIKTEKQINRYYSEINKSIFSMRNKMAHGDLETKSITQENYLVALKKGMSMIWELDQKSRHLLIPIVYNFDPSTLIDDKLIKNCLKEFKK